MNESGIVQEWHADEGWGVVDCAGAPGGCWVHFSAVVMAGYRELSPGQPVTVEYEPADQDGYRFRAEWVRPEGTPVGTPVGTPAGAPEGPGGPPAAERSTAYRSSLTLGRKLPPSLTGDGGSGGLG